MLDILFMFFVFVLECGVWIGGLVGRLVFSGGRFYTDLMYDLEVDGLNGINLALCGIVK